MLEQKLEQADQQEASPLFLGKSRCDRNTDRISLLAEIEHRLADYGTEAYRDCYNLSLIDSDVFLERTNRTLNFGTAQQRDVESLQNWLSGTGCLAREETAYLGDRELISLAPAGDNAIIQLETWVENQLIRFSRRFRKVREMRACFGKLTRCIEPFS